MVNEKESEKIPMRKLPKFKITKTQIRDMKAASRILESLAEKPDILKKVTEELIRAGEAPEEERAVANYELKYNIMDILAAEVKDLPEEDIEKNLHILWAHMPHSFVDMYDYTFAIPHSPWVNQYWDQYWEGGSQVEGPVEGQAVKGRRRVYRW